METCDKTLYYRCTPASLRPQRPPMALRSSVAHDDRHAWPVTPRYLEADDAATRRGEFQWPPGCRFRRQRQLCGLLLRGLLQNVLRRRILRQGLRDGHSEKAMKHVCNPCAGVAPATVLQSSTHIQRQHDAMRLNEGYRGRRHFMADSPYAWAYRGRRHYMADSPYATDAKDVRAGGDGTTWPTAPMQQMQKTCVPGATALCGRQPLCSTSSFHAIGVKL